jgi:hypothetical protein
LNGRPGASEEPIIGIGSDEILAAEVRLATPSKFSPVTELLSYSTAGVDFVDDLWGVLMVVLFLLASISASCYLPSS